MPEVLVQFETIVTARDGRRFLPRACGRPSGHVWEGWIEFAPADHAGEPVRTSRETVQPKRDDLLYWAQGLTQVFLEGALSRALQPTVFRERGPQLRPFFEGPAPAVVTTDASAARRASEQVEQRGDDRR